MPIDVGLIRVHEVPLYHTDEGEHRRKLASAVNEALRGRISSILDVALLAGTSTPVTDARVGPNTFVGLSPLDANAAGDVASMYAVAGDGSFTIFHAANPGARTVRCALLG